MPSREQIETVVEQIEDVVDRRYIEGDGDLCSCWFQPEGGGSVGMTVFQGVPEGTPEPFDQIPDKAKIELLDTYVDWEGFDDAQEWSVIRRVIAGEDREFWMDGIASNSEYPMNEKPGTRTYEVWHDTGWPESRIAQPMGIRSGEGSFPAGYVHVANVQADGLQQAVEMSTDKGGIIDDPRRWQPWERNEGVEALVKAPRDTVAGDVIVDPSGRAFRVERDGFREMNEAGHAFDRLMSDNDAFHAELQTDYHAARVRDYGEADAATFEQRLEEGARMAVTEYQDAIDAAAHRGSSRSKGKEGIER